MAAPIFPILAVGGLILWLTRRGKAAAPAPRSEDSIFLPIAPPAGMLVATDEDIAKLTKGSRVRVYLQLNEMNPDPSQAPIPTNRVFLSEGTIETVPAAGEPNIYNYVHERVVNPGTFGPGEPFRKGEDIAFIVTPREIATIVSIPAIPTVSASV